MRLLSDSPGVNWFLCSSLNISRYQLLQGQFEADIDEARRDKIEEAMTMLLGNIERNRDDMGSLARELNKIK